jgi:hypothetical protein
MDHDGCPYITLTETSEAAESWSLTIKGGLLIAEVWARNSVYQFSPFISHAKSLDYKIDLYSIVIME